MFVDVDVEIGAAKVTLSCLVQGGDVERVTPYFNGRRWPKLQRWADAFVASDHGRDVLDDAIADAEDDRANDYPDRD